MASLLDIGRDLLPGVEFSTRTPVHAVDLCVLFGDTRASATARHVISLNASPWSAYLRVPGNATRWSERNWPFGALAAGALAAGEAFKISMRKLRKFARVPANFDELFAATAELCVDLAPVDAPRIADLGSFDIVSGGAITNSVLFCLGRIPSVEGAARIIEDSTSDYSNLNRYSLLRRSQTFVRKVDTLLGIDFGSLKLQGAPVRLDERTALDLAPFASHVIVGVDHVPTRWLDQRVRPGWLGIGATTHWGAMASFHERELACAWCLHPRDDAGGGHIPTAAFVSFWSGLLLAAYFVRSAAGQTLASRDQHVYMTPIRPESIWRAPVAVRSDCPLCGPHSSVRVA